MRYYTKGNRYSAGFLRNVGRTAYGKMRQNPLSTAEMERGNSVSTYVADDIDVQVRISQKSEGPDASVVEHSIDLVEVILPKTEYWAEQRGVVAAPPWLQLVTRTTLMDNSFCEMQDIFFSHFTLAQIAQVWGKDIQELEEMVIAVHIAPSCLADQVLAASVVMTDDDPGGWDVDIRGFALSMVIMQFPSDGITGLPVGDSDCFIENSAK